MAGDSRKPALARDYAVRAHGDQTYGDLPYVVHLDAVVSVLRGWWGLGGADILAAAYLHDVLEDTSATYADLVGTFGSRVADIVWACTGEGETRDQRTAAIYAKVARDGSAAVVKLADRVANLEACTPRSAHADRYAREHKAFVAALKPHVPRTCWDRYVTAVSAVMGTTK
ncbi:HD domain-containing protein [Pseudomonas sp. ODNR1LW]|nr:HD domain-containing protein [Pseudomonas sp. ODNR1LW]